MALIKHAGVNCTDAYNSIFSDAHVRCATGSSVRDEPHFVRDLISEQTVRRLNAESPNLYDQNVNAVNFRATFLHGSPYAKFTAGQENPRCELADGMFVVYVTEPAGNGIHKVTRRAACLLMVKRSGDQLPLTFPYDPVNGPDPVGTDHSQFYLFHRWPRFELQTGYASRPKGHGFYQIAVPPNGAGAAAHDIGKFGVLWDHGSGRTTWKTNQNSVHWLAGEPIPGTPVDPAHESLGKLLEDLVDGATGAGREFMPAPSNPGGWDGLMGTLLGYPIAGPTVPGAAPLTVDSIMAKWTWGGKQKRDVNPLGLGFLAQHRSPIGLDIFEALDTVRGTIAQHARQLALGDFDHVPFHARHSFPLHYLNDAMKPTPPHFYDLAGEAPPPRFPVLIATVTRFRSDELPLESRALTLEQRATAIDRAIEQAYDLLRYLS